MQCLCTYCVDLECNKKTKNKNKQQQTKKQQQQHKTARGHTRSCRTYFRKRRGRITWTFRNLYKKSNRQFETLARRECIRQLKDEVDRLFEQMSETLDKLDSRCFNVEKGMDSMKVEIYALKKHRT